MNKKDILIDFSVHLLLLGDEFYNDELHFFDCLKRNEANYQNYVAAICKLINVEDFIWDTNVNVPISKIEKLGNLISEKEIEFFQEYINNEFSFGYPDEINEDGFAYGRSYSLNLSIQDIESHFLSYLDLKNLNPSQYITYYQQFLEFLNRQSNMALAPTMDEIDNFYKSESSIESIEYSILKDKLKSDLNRGLLEAMKKTPFQIQGSYDKFGFVLNFKDTLKLILKQYSNKYSTINLSIESKQYYALAKYEYYLFKFHGKEAVSNAEELKILKEEFEVIKLKNSKQIQFLKTKGFDNREIDIILNCFSLNKFNSLGIRHIRNLSKVSFFGLFYFFYRFEFLKREYNINFDAQNDFLKSPIVEEKGFIDPNMYDKYYKHSDDIIYHWQQPDNNYPFKQSKKLLNKINKELYIDLKKLNIPSNLEDSIKDIL